MKKSAVFLLLTFLFACDHKVSDIHALQTRIENLEHQLSETYKPGFGEFMSNIQSHHAKLWFAGMNENWKLADFEIKEIRETFDDLQKYQTERPESQMIEMILPPLDSVNLAIKQKDPVQFKHNYTLLTNTCNNCHHETNFEFNVVKIPKEQMFSNQEFTTK